MDWKSDKAKKEAAAEETALKSEAAAEEAAKLAALPPMAVVNDRPRLATTMSNAKHIRVFVASSGEKYTAGLDSNFKIKPKDVKDAKRHGFYVIEPPNIVTAAKAEHYVPAPPKVA